MNNILINSLVVLIFIIVAIFVINLPIWLLLLIVITSAIVNRVKQNKDE
jgi:hypothetical protein